MEPVTVQTAIDAPREEVFDFLLDLANHPAFLDHFVSEFRLERLNSVGIGAAARFKVQGRLDAHSLWFEMVIDEAERPHRIHMRGRTGRLGRIPCDWVWELTETAGGLAEVTLTARSQPSLLADRAREIFGAGGFLKRRSAKALSRLRDIIEGRATSTARATTAGGSRVATGVR